MDDTSKGQYTKVSALVDQWLEMHKGETFNLDTICRQLELTERDLRNYVTQKLSYETRRGFLEKNNHLYRYIDNTFKLIDWVNANEDDTLNINWPFGHEDDSRFGFDGNVVIFPGDIIVIAGGSNYGKTTFCLNFLWENMDNFPCTLMGNEYTPVKFKRRISRMGWNSPTNGDGVPKFELIERREGWKDIIRPDNINIIDWINLGDNFYQIGTIIEGIQSKLRGGIAVISIQKDDSKKYGLGGGFSQHLSSLYISIDFGRMTIVKAKEWSGRNINNEMYGFEIIEAGSTFDHIRRIRKCGSCFATGKSKGQECFNCAGMGYVDYKEG